MDRQASIGVFCSRVCEFVRFQPDHEGITEELAAHLEDHRDALLAAHPELSPRQAAAQAVQAMGSPEELGRSLDAIHNPLLGRLLLWLLRGARVAGVLMLLYILSQAGAIAANLLAAPKYTGNVGLGGVLEHADPERILADFQPEGRWQWEGYTFSVSRALILSGNQDESKGLYYQLKVTHPNPWLRGPEFRMWLWAEDELGNRYPSRGQQDEEALPASMGDSAGNPSAEYPFVSYYDLWVIGIQPEARELTLRFNRYGENVIYLTIPLEGGTEYD